jgi:hypothetical protein
VKASREKLDCEIYDLVPFEEITAAEHGANKYSDWNWSIGLPRTQIISLLLRHTFKLLRGQRVDPESNLLHSDHILWNAVALSHSFHHNIGDENHRCEPKRAYHDETWTHRK